jgi:hypothetical protein
LSDGEIEERSKKSVKRKKKRKSKRNNLKRSPNLRRRRRRSKLKKRTMTYSGRPQVLLLTKRRTLDMKNLVD